DRTRISIAVVAAAALLLTGGVAAQVLVILSGAVLGLVLLKPSETQAAGDSGSGGAARATGARIGVLTLLLFGAALLALPAVARSVDSEPLSVADSFYRSGSLVFGGGHVVLPLLEAEVVPTEWVTKDEFLAGYGAAQAVPGPLFTFSAYLGTVMGVLDPWWLGGLLALGAIFLPSFLLVWGVLPFWERLRGFARVRRALMGVNAAVVGILLAALYDPVWTSAIGAPEDFALGAAAFVLLAFWKTPPWLVVALAAVGGAGLAAL
ncbi:MAG: chromate transporter, partial [Chloroflexota bacterium]|nr:chromate transporter [Chloroflexota bacterium]